MFSVDISDSEVGAVAKLLHSTSPNPSPNPVTNPNPNPKPYRSLF